MNVFSHEEYHLVMHSKEKCTKFHDKRKIPHNFAPFSYKDCAISKLKYSVYMFVRIRINKMV